MKKPVVLIVDDEFDIRSMILEYLRGRFDCDFKEACDGEEALKFIKSNPCDVMFLDIKLPKKNGILVLEEAKKIGLKIDIIVVTGYSSDEVAEESLMLGAIDYAPKPLNLEVLALKFAKILEKRGFSGISKI